MIKKIIVMNLLFLMVIGCTRTSEPTHNAFQQANGATNNKESEASENITPEVVNIHEKIDIGGYGLVVKISGIKSSYPVIIFESGLGATSDTWDRLQSELSKRTLTVSYDRA